MSTNDTQVQQSRTSAVSAEVRAEDARLRSQLHSTEQLLWVMLWLIGGFVLVDLAVAYNFNAALVLGDPKSAPTFGDQIARLFASLMMVAVVTAGVFALHVACARESMPTAARVVAFSIGIVVILSAGLIAAASAYPLFSHLLGEVVNGVAPPPAGLGLDAAQAPPAPLWARLATGAPVLAAGLVVAILEIVALKLHEKASGLREKIARGSVMIVFDDRALQAEKEQWSAGHPVEERLAKIDPARRANVVKARVQNLIAKYARALDAKRPVCGDLRLITSEEYQRYQQRLEAWEKAMASLREINEADINRCINDALTPRLTRVV